MSDTRPIEHAGLPRPDDTPTTVLVDMVAEAREGLDRARRMQAAAEADVAVLSAEGETLAEEMDHLQAQYEARATRLTEVREAVKHHRDVARLSQDSAESFEDVLKLHGE